MKYRGRYIMREYGGLTGLLYYSILTEKQKQDADNNKVVYPIRETNLADAKKTVDKIENKG